MADVKSPKSNEKAVHFRQEGNRLYVTKKFEDAVEMYNKSICWAENGSEDLGMAYANRSAVFFELREYEMALANIVAAKRNNYPERLMAKLEARERDCRQQLNDPNRIAKDKEMSKLYPKVALNMKVNPRIPFIAKDMHAEVVASGDGIVMVADRDFKVGDVILSEKPLPRRSSTYERFQCCNYCMLMAAPIPIPCPRCAYAIYCSEDCREEAWNRFHCFECDISQKLHKIFREYGIFASGIQMFLYGLSLFKDDVKKTMEFWETLPKAGSDPLSSVVNYDPKEEFKMVQMVHGLHLRKMGIRPSSYLLLHPKKSLAAKLYNVYRENSVIKSLSQSKSKQAAMHRCFMHYALTYPWCLKEEPRICDGAIASLFMKKAYADSNLTSVTTGGCLKLVVHRAVPKGSQLTLQLDSSNPTNSDGSSICNCSGIDCIKNVTPSLDLLIMDSMLTFPNTNPVVITNTLPHLQQLLQKYSHLQPRCRFSNWVKAQQDMLTEICVQQVHTEMRASAISEISTP